MGIDSNNACSRKKIIEKVRKVLDDMDNAKVEGRCCCTDPDNPPPGFKVVKTSTLDNQPGVPRLVPDFKDRVIWSPPPVDNRPPLDSTMSCYAATVANQFYDQYKGCRLDCGGQEGAGGQAGTSPHCHWWNSPKSPPGQSPPPTPGQSSPPSPAQGKRNRDYCEDPNFEPPEPLGHQSWTYEPGGTCRHPQYCKADCFDHYPEKDWARH